MNAIAEKPLRAFAVQEDDEATGGIVFARHAVVARRHGANEYAGGDFDRVSCRRAAWADRYADSQIVPASLMIAHGWHFECSGCGHRIDIDFLDERDIWLADVQGHQEGHVFCTPLCEARHHLERAEAKHRETRWIRRFAKIVRRRFPDAVIVDDGNQYCRPHAYASYRNGRWVVEQVIVSFTWPGQQIGPATLRMDTRTEWLRGGGYVTKRTKPHWTCCSGDREAFEAYAAASRAGKDEDNGPTA
jgi:hypothetical protein